MHIKALEWQDAKTAGDVSPPRGAVSGKGEPKMNRTVQVRLRRRMVK